MPTAADAMEGSQGAITSEDKAIRIAQLCDEQKGQDIVTLDIHRQCSFTDCIVLITGMSNSHLRAMLSIIAQDMKQNDSVVLGTEGGDDSSWLLMDYGDVVVHLFLEETRAYYNIERLWGDGRQVEWQADVART